MSETTVGTENVVGFPAKYVGRDEAIKAIRTHLRRRSGKDWSVKGGRGTAWGWIKVNAPPKRRTWKHVPSGGVDEHGYPEYVEVEVQGAEFGHMSPADREELAKLLGLERVHTDGVSIPASNAYYREYVERAQGIPVTVFGTQYWD